MFREPNLGAYAHCSHCGRRFWTEVGETQCMSCERNGYRENHENDQTEDDDDWE